MWAGVYVWICCNVLVPNLELGGIWSMLKTSLVVAQIDKGRYCGFGNLESDIEHSDAQ